MDLLKRPGRLAAVVASILAVSSSVAHAHPLQSTSYGLEAGFAHPFLGLDHMLAMLAVGLWASQSDDRRARWLVPSAFVVTMAFGGWAGLEGLPLPFDEAGIAASLVLLGVLLALAVRLPLVAGAALVGLFAIVHGHAHGTEMPLTASPVLYGLGFMTATALLHAGGIALGVLARSGRGQGILRAASAGIAAYGLFLMQAAV
jgi:urease accessory protein